jgi:hypothetical protein
MLVTSSDAHCALRQLVVAHNTCIQAPMLLKRLNIQCPSSRILARLAEAAIRTAAPNRIVIIVVGVTGHLSNRAAQAPPGGATITTSTAGVGNVRILANSSPRAARENTNVYPKDTSQNKRTQTNVLDETKRVNAILAFNQNYILIFSDKASVHFQSPHDTHDDDQHYNQYTHNSDNRAGIAPRRSNARSSTPVSTHACHHLA